MKIPTEDKMRWGGEDKDVEPLDDSTWRALDRFERKMKRGGMVQIPADEFRALVSEVRRSRTIGAFAPGDAA